MRFEMLIDLTLFRRTLKTIAIMNVDMDINKFKLKKKDTLLRNTPHYKIHSGR